MGIPGPREMAKIRRTRAVCLGLVLSVILGQIFFSDDVHYIYDRLGKERRPEPPDKTLYFFLQDFHMYELGSCQGPDRHLAEVCQQGYAPGCLLRGLMALECPEEGGDPNENRKLAEKFFRQGCATGDLPVCRLIEENRKDDESRNPEDEERVILGILMMGCGMGSEMTCGNAAQAVFREGGLPPGPGLRHQGLRHEGLGRKTL